MLRHVIVAFGLASAAALSVACSGGPTIDESAPIPTCDTRPLDPDVERLISPVILSFLQGSHDELELVPPQIQPRDREGVQQKGGGDSPQKHYR